MSGEVGAFREVLSEQAVGVLVGAALPWTLRVAEVDGQVGVCAELSVLCHFGALVPGQRAAELLGQRGDRRSYRVSDGLGTMAGESGPVFGSLPFAVAWHGWEVQQYVNLVVRSTSVPIGTPPGNPVRFHVASVERSCEVSSSDSEPLTDEQHVQLAAEMHARWQQGEPKSRLEIEYWGNVTAHGKAFSAYVRRWLRVETERQSTQSARIAHLEALLRANGISPTEAWDLPEEYRLLAKSRESVLAAVRVYNDPDARFRTETFVVLMVIAWNSLLQAMLERSNVDYYERDEHGAQIVVGGRAKVLGTWQLVHLALAGDDYRAVRANLDFFLRLRDQISHRYLPALDVAVTGEAQSMLLNFENVLAAQFGEEAALGDRLAVPLQLSGFRNEGSLRSLRKAQAKLPTDVSDFLASHRTGVDDDVLASSEYCLQIFFVPVIANRERSADAVVRFVPPDKVTPGVGETALEDRGRDEATYHPCCIRRSAHPDRGYESRRRALAVRVHNGHSHKVLENTTPSGPPFRFTRARSNRRSLLPMGPAREGIRLYQCLG